MKKIYVSLVLCMVIFHGFSQALFTYGSHAVSKDEFLKAYNKNKTAVTDQEKSFREYLDLYSRFKLKVLAAQMQRLDTLQQLQFDLQNFRSQVADGYMNDEKGLRRLISEAIERSRKDIHLVHFSVPVNAAMSPADTNKIYKAMTELASELAKGTNDYDAITKDITKKYLEVKQQDLGFITAFSLPYDIENIVYALKPGGISKGYRTKSALHIFKHAGERESAGKWTVAQILISVPPNSPESEFKIAEKKADSIYQLLINGADFKALAKQYSSDKLTYQAGGEMPEFGTGKYDSSFETKVFGLKKDGDISKPIFTGYGYHIVKRLHHRELPADENNQALKQQVLQDTRINEVKAYFVKEVKLKAKYKRNIAVKDAELFRYADSVSSTASIANFPINNKTIFSFDKLNVKGADWLNFVKDYKLNKDVYKGEGNKELLEKYITITSFEYYRQHLEEYNDEFKYQIKEFKEGNMLFEIMERNIWSKAASDSTGLEKFYNDHRDKYQWSESANIILFNCSDEKVAQVAITDLEKGVNWKKIAEDSEQKIQSDSGRYEVSQLPLPVGVSLKEGVITKPLTTGGDNTTSFIKVLKTFPANQQRSFDEARGLVINDYQGYLEEKWVEQLKKKYPLKINETVFQSLLK